MYLWDTDEGGPCVLRPTPNTAHDAPNPDDVTASWCTEDGLDSKGQCKFLDGPKDGRMYSCQNAWCDEDNVMHDAGSAPKRKEAVGPLECRSRIQ